MVLKCLCRQAGSLVTEAALVRRDMRGLYVKLEG